VENPVGGLLTFVLTGDESAGVVTAVETVAAPGEGPPLHVHDQDELIYLLEGQLRVRLEDDLHDAEAGSLVFIPRDVRHTWQNIGETEARFIVTLTPAAPEFERFFVRFGDLPASERGPDAFARLARETNAFEVVGPPLSLSDGATS
jgi:quercetin dioxygenase-like cupin family protein